MMRDAHEALALARLQTMLTQMVWADRRGEVRAGQGQGEAVSFRWLRTAVIAGVEEVPVTQNSSEPFSFRKVGRIDLEQEHHEPRLRV